MCGLPDQLRLLLTGTPPRRIGFSPGPLTHLRVARHAVGRALRTRPLRLCLLEHDTSTMYFAEPTAFWINQRSRVCWAERNGPPERADLVWVFTQDPLTPEVRAWLAERLRRVRPGVRVLNPPAVYDAYHDLDCFPRLAAAGVRVPRTEFGPADVGVTPVVYKAAASRRLARSSAGTTARGPASARRSPTTAAAPTAGTAATAPSCWATSCCPRTSIVADHWNASLRHLVTVERNYALTEFERRQLLLINSTLGLDFSCVDYLREHDTGTPVFHDVNVYPTVVGAWQGDMPAGDHGRWHVFDNCDRLRLPPPGGRSGLAAGRRHTAAARDRTHDKGHGIPGRRLRNRAPGTPLAATTRRRSHDRLTPARRRHLERGRRTPPGSRTTAAGAGSR